LQNFNFYHINFDKFQVFLQNSRFFFQKCQLTWNLRQQSNLRIFIVVNDEDPEVRCHYSTTSALTCRVNLRVDDFRVVCFLSHAELVEILAEEIVDQYDAVFLHAYKLFGVAPAHCEERSGVPLEGKDTNNRR
jgi:hypothetical protein